MQSSVTLWKWPSGYWCTPNFLLDSRSLCAAYIIMRIWYIYIKPKLMCSLSFPSSRELNIISLASLLLNISIQKLTISSVIFHICALRSWRGGTTVRAGAFTEYVIMPLGVYTAEQENCVSFQFCTVHLQKYPFRHNLLAPSLRVVHVLLMAFWLHLYHHPMTLIKEK